MSWKHEIKLDKGAIQVNVHFDCGAGGIMVLCKDDIQAAVKSAVEAALKTGNVKTVSHQGENND